MQRIALYISLILLLGQSQIWAQSPYLQRLILKNTSVSDRLNPCYLLSVLDSVKHGTIDTVYISSGKIDLLYTPDADFLGTDTLVIKYYDKNDYAGKLIYKSFVYESVNSYLGINNDFITVYTDQQNVEFNPLANDSSSVPGFPKITLKNLPAANNVSSYSIVNDSILKFSCPSGFAGSASVTYRVCDVFNLCKEGTVNIYIVDTNNIKTNDTVIVYTPEDVPVQILMPYEGFTKSINAKHGALTIEGGSFRYSPFKDFNGKDTFKLVKNNLVRWVFMTVIPQDEPNSILVPDIFYTPENTDITFDVSINDVHPLVGLYSIAVDTNKTVKKGTLNKLDTKGNFKYIPQTNYSGVQSFEYKVCPQGNCEYTKVKLYIGNYEPVATNEYVINTYKNVPIMLNYQVPVDAYNFSSTSTRIDYYPGLDTITILYGGSTNNSCSATSIGFNQLKFTPLNNTIYTDTFRINYCIASTNKCVEVKVKINVSYEGTNCPKQCVGDCVWPGDVDQNGCVDMKDLLSLACEIGKTGKQRLYPNIDYRSHTSTDWGGCLMNSGVDLKNADCNGDSIINVEDTLAIYNSYKLTHSLIPNEVFSKGSFPFDFVIQDTSVEIGDWAYVDVVIGNEQYPVVNMSGYSYDLDYDVNILDENSLYVHYYEQDWFGRTATMLNMFKKPWDGHLESGNVRANAAKVSGKGKTEVLVFIVEDDLLPFSKDEEFRTYPLHFNNIKYMDSNGELFTVDDKILKLTLARKKSNDPVELNEKKLLLFPNPATEFLTIHMNGANTISSYKIYSIDGRELINNIRPDSKTNQVRTSSLSAGFYILQVKTPVGVICKKFEIVN